MQVNKQDQSYSKAQWIIGVVLIPLAFTVILGAIIWGVIAGDISEKAISIGNSIPVVKNFVPDPQTEAAVIDPKENEIERLTNEIVGLKKQVNEKDLQIEELNKLLDEKNLLLAEIETNVKSADEERVNEDERKQQLTEIADLYSSMSASKAAPIVSALTLSESTLIMSFMDEEARAEILSKMDPQRAANISILIKDQKLSENEEIAALQERIQELTVQLSSFEQNTSTVSEIISTYNSMQPESAAEILTELYSIDRAGTISILSSVDSNQRSLILANMEASIAAAITRAINNN